MYNHLLLNQYTICVENMRHRPTQALRYSYVMLGARRELRPRSQCVVGTRARYQIARTLRTSLA